MLLFAGLWPSGGTLAQVIESGVANAPNSTQVRVREVVLPYAAMQTPQQSNSANYGDLTLSEPALTACSVVGTTKTILRLNLNLGERYDLGDLAAPIRVHVHLQGLSAANANVALPAGLTSTVDLTVSQSAPTQVFEYQLPMAAYTYPDKMRVTATVDATIAGNAATTAALRLVARLEQHQAMNLQGVATSPLVPLSPVGNVVFPYNQFERTLAWQAGCQFTKLYQIQLLHYRIANAPEQGDLIDEKLWSTRATLLEKELSPAQQLQVQTNEASQISVSAQVTVAEGVGYYAWRVRAIGTLAGGTGNPDNLGPWSNHALFQLADAGTSTSTLTDLNWSYSRTFSEGGRMAERLTMANGLLQTRQVLSRMASTQQILGLQTIQDYNGRNALISLPIPLLPGTGATTLKYVPNLLKNTSGAAYSAADFDQSSNYNDPAPANEQDGYYGAPTGSSPTASQQGVAQAEQRPFLRALYSRDGTNRVIEQAGAGRVLGLHPTTPTTATETHTVRTTYSSVAQQELNQLFGAQEAPLADNVLKTITTDPNNTSTITYQTKAGQTIATALSSNSGSPTLETLPSFSAARDITYQVTARTAYLDRGSSSTTLFVIPPGAATTEVRFNYAITRQVIEAAQCENFCSTCDYRVQVRVKNMDDPSVIIEIYDRTVPLANTCGPDDDEYNYPEVVRYLPPGTYAVEKIVTAYNSATVAGPTYLDGKLDALQADYESIKTSGIWADINSYLAANNYQGLYTALQEATNNSSSGVSLVNTGDKSQSYIVRFGCNGEIEIPVMDCEDMAPPCPFPKTTFSEYLKQEAIDVYNNIGTYFPGLSQSSDIDGMIEAMLGDSELNVSCSSLFSCWQATISSNAIANPNPPTNMGVVPPNLLKHFLECVGSPIRKIIKPGQLDYKNIYLSLIYDDNNANDHDCLQSLLQPGLPVDINLLSDCDYAALAACIEAKNSQNASNPPLTQQDVEAKYAEMTAKCVQHCDDRRMEFRQAILRSFRKQGLYTYLDKYELELYANDGNAIASMQQLIADLEQQIRDLKVNNPEGWKTLQDLQTQLEVLKDQVPQTLAVKQQIKCVKEDLQAVINNLGASNVDQLMAWQSQIREIQISISNQQPSEYVVTTELLDPNKTHDPNGKVIASECEIDLMVEELVQQCRSECNITVTFDSNGQPIAPSLEQIDRFQNAFIAAADVVVRPVDGDCAFSYTPTPSMGTFLEKVELTKCAIDVVSYMSRLTQKFFSLPGFPNYPNLLPDYAGYSSYGPDNTIGPNGFPMSVPGYNGTAASVTRDLLPRPAIGQSGIGESWPYILSYIGPLSKDCNRVFNDDCNKDFSERENYWISIQDARGEDPITPLPYVNTFSNRHKANPAENNAYVRDTDFRIVWGGYDSGTGFPYKSTISPSNESICMPSGYDVWGVPQLVEYTGGRCLTTSWGGLEFDYILRFINAATKQKIEKSTIRSLSAPYLETASVGQGSYADSFSPAFVCVDILPANGTQAIKAYIELESAANTKTPYFLKWKSVEQCKVDKRTYETCYRWVLPANLPDPYAYNPVIPTCAEALSERLRNTIASQQAATVEKELSRYRQQYASSCAAPSNLNDALTFKYKLGYHHYTLYYYDRAGNLVKTVPPAGVDVVDVAANPNAVPNHRMATTYEYNSLKQLVRQQTPDGGVTDFIYNRAGQLRFSVNDKQAPAGVMVAGQVTRYSYTKYDALGRVVEVGESSEDAVFRPNDDIRVSVLAMLQVQAENSAFPAPGNGQWQTKTFYNRAKQGMAYLFGIDDEDVPAYLTNRVAYTESYDPSAPTEPVRTHYSYDPHGNVEWLAQEIPGLGTKFVRYEYDLLSNKVLKVLYQEGELDQFYHRYEYDDDNRLTAVYTSPNGRLWDQDATYTYYAHGPLKRLELGQDKVQGIDYTYTLQGWLKAINHSDLNATLDPRQDGLSASSAAADAFGMTLGYYRGDYVRPGSPLTASTSNTANNDLFEPQPTEDLFNGNIATWQSKSRQDVPNSPTSAVSRVNELYKYDQLNRLKSSTQFGLAGGGRSARPDYATTYDYDANGNILHLTRNASNSENGSNLALDNLSYHYDAPQGPLQHNKLGWVTDGVQNSLPEDDLESQPADNYAYDALGNLIQDTQSKVSKIEWTPYGKIARITKIGQGPVNTAAYEAYTTYRYDAMGHRSSKAQAHSADVLTTYYVRDAQGNILATYEQQGTGSDAPLWLREQPLYGSQRLGLRRADVQLAGNGPATGTTGRGRQSPLVGAVGARQGWYRRGCWGRSSTS
jgi:hypothetical protein